jgi:hypothetical protein
VVDVDAIVRAKVEPGLAEQAQSALADVEEADRLLEQAVVLVDRAHPDLNDDEREEADLLRASAVTRREMLRYAPSILEANEQAASALEPSETGWAALLAADKLSDQAVTAYNKLTKAGVGSSQKLNVQAAEKLSESGKRFTEAETAFPAAPFEDYSAYVATRVKLNALSQQSDKYWLAGDVAKANKVIGDYNRLDAQAVKQAAELPASTAAAVAAAYEKATDALLDRYYEARDRALAADKTLREY